MPGPNFLLLVAVGAKENLLGKYKLGECTSLGQEAAVPLCVQGQPRPKLGDEEREHTG